MRFRSLGPIGLLGLFVLLVSQTQLSSQARTGLDLPDAHNEMASKDRIERLEGISSISPSEAVSSPGGAHNEVPAQEEDLLNEAQAISGSVKASEKPLDKSLDKNPVELSIWQSKRAVIKHLDQATKYGMQGQFQAAFTEYQQALNINPLLPDAYVGKAAIYGYQGQWTKATLALQTALKMPNNFLTPANKVNAEFNLSSCYCLQGNAAAAWENYDTNLKGKHPKAASLATFMQKNCPAEETATQPAVDTNNQQAGAPTDKQNTEQTQ